MLLFRYGMLSNFIKENWVSIRITKVKMLQTGQIWIGEAVNFAIDILSRYAGVRLLTVHMT
jgi:hypothetical protein